MIISYVVTHLQQLPLKNKFKLVRPKIIVLSVTIRSSCSYILDGEIIDDKINVFMAMHESFFCYINA